MHTTNTHITTFQSSHYTPTKVRVKRTNHDGRTTPTLAKASDAQAGKSRLGNNLRKKSCTKAGNLVGKLSFHNAHTKTQKAIEKNSTCPQQLTGVASSSAAAEKGMIKAGDVLFNSYTSKSATAPFIPNTSKSTNRITTILKPDNHLMSNIMHCDKMAG